MGARPDEEGSIGGGGRSRSGDEDKTSEDYRSVRYAVLMAALLPPSRSSG